MRDIFAGVGGLLTALALMTASAGAFHAQGEVTAAQQTAPLRARAEHVAVDVIVTDAHDRPVTDLAADDFEIVEGGKVQDVADFRELSIAVGRPAGTQVPMAPDVATNMPPSPDSRLFVLVIDDLHIIESDVSAVKNVINEFVRSLAPDDQMAIVFVGRSDLSVNVTSDRARLTATAGRVKEALGFGLDALGHSTASNLAQADGRIVFEYAVRADEMLRNVALAIAGSGHARRAIVYVSGGSILDTTPVKHDGGVSFDDRDFLKAVYEAARRADAPIYTLDPRGLVDPSEAVRAGIGAVGNPSLPGYAEPPPGARRAIVAANIVKQQDRLRQDAESTGGRALVDRNDLVAAVDEIVAENGSVYVLGYYPDPFISDGKFHPLIVHVKRSGLRVRARPGYVATSSEVLSSPNSEAVLSSAMGQALDLSGLPLRVAAAPILQAGDTVSTAVTVDVEYPAGLDASAAATDDLSVQMLALDPDAKVKATANYSVRFAIPASNGVARVVRLNDRISLPMQPLTLRIGVSSRALARTGTVQMPVDVGKRSKLRLSAIVLGDTSDTAQGYRFDTIRSLVPFPPTTNRTFSQHGSARLFARASWSSESADPRVTIDVPGDPTFRREVTIPRSVVGGGAFEAILDTTLPLTGISIGQHQLEVKVGVGNLPVVARSIVFQIR